MHHVRRISTETIKGFNHKKHSEVQQGWLKKPKRWFTSCYEVFAETSKTLQASCMKIFHPLLRVFQLQLYSLIQTTAVARKDTQYVLAKSLQTNFMYNSNFEVLLSVIFFYYLPYLSIQIFCLYVYVNIYFIFLISYKMTKEMVVLNV